MNYIYLGKNDIETYYRNIICLILYRMKKTYVRQQYENSIFVREFDIFSIYLILKILKLLTYFFFL